MITRLRDAMYGSCSRTQCSPSLFVLACILVLAFLALRFRATVIHVAEATLVAICSVLFVWLLWEIVRLVMRIRASDAARMPSAVVVSDESDTPELAQTPFTPGTASPEESEDAAIARAREALAEHKKEGTP